jgi:hypothetical protein
MNASRCCAALAAIFLVASSAGAQDRISETEQLKQELAALRAEVTALKKEVARLSKKDEEERAAKLKALREEVAKLTREEEEEQAKKRLAGAVKAWKSYHAEVKQRNPATLMAIPSVQEELLRKGETKEIPVFSFLKEKRSLAPRSNMPNAPRETYEVSLYQEGILTRVPDPGVPFGLDLTGIGQSATDVMPLKGLGRLKSLVWLKASPIPIADEALKEMGELTNLRWLDLRYNGRITDAGLKELSGLKKLEVLDLRGSPYVTDAGVAELQKALPNCTIVR